MREGWKQLTNCCRWSIATHTTTTPAGLPVCPHPPARPVYPQPPCEHWVVPVRSPLPLLISGTSSKRSLSNVLPSTPTPVISSLWTLKSTDTCLLTLQPSTPMPEMSSPLTWPATWSTNTYTTSTSQVRPCGICVIKLPPQLSTIKLIIVNNIFRKLGTLTLAFSSLLVILCLSNPPYG